MDDDAQVREAPDESPAEAHGPEERAGEFERYALVAALTVVVLGLLVWDNWHGGEDPVPPAPDRRLRVELGGARSPGPGPQAEPTREQVRAVDTPAPPAPPTAREYVVKAGETLGEIAGRELGSAKRSQEIAEMNGIADPARIRAGQVLKLPLR